MHFWVVKLSRFYLPIVIGLKIINYVFEQFYKIIVKNHTLEIWYNFKNCSNLFKRIVNRFKRAGCALDIMRKTAWPIMVEGYAALFSCTAMVQASDSMMASMWS